MSGTLSAVKYIIEIGPVVIIPSLLFIIGLFATRNILKNLKNIVFILLGMVSTSVLMTIFINFFEPIASNIIINSNKNFEIIDTGWLISEKIMLGSPVLLQIIIAVFVLNIVMLVLRFTRTINIDLWNYWNFLFIGSIVFSFTGIKWIAIFVALIAAAITLVISDIYSPFIKQYVGLENISNPQANIICWAPVTHFINNVFNKIPFIKKINIFCEEIQYRAGIFSEPIIIGFILGFMVSIISRFQTVLLNPGYDLRFSLINGFRLSIIIFLLPRATNLMLRGLVPALNDIQSFLKRRVSERDLYLGLDSIFLVSQPAVICLSVILIPLTIYMATFLPGNKMLPSADLIMIPFILVWAVVPSKGDLIRSFLSALIIISLLLWITSDMGSIFTSFFINNNMDLVEGYKEISSIGGSSNIFFWVLLQIVRPIFNLF